MPHTTANGIDLYYESFGNDDDPPLLLIMGLGAQCIHWPDDFAHAFVDRGFRVIRFDNRDAGLSTGFDESVVDITVAAEAHLAGEALDAPYKIHDMAADAAGLLEALDLREVHVMGASLGGMVAQAVVADFPDRVASLISIMSNTGEPDFGQPSPEALAMLLEPGAEGRDAVIEQNVSAARLIGSPEAFDEEYARSLAARAYDRAYRPQGTARQLAAIAASPSREDALRALTVPALVIHGTADVLIDPSGGARTAELIPDAEHLEIEGMGHDLPPNHWAQMIERTTALAVRSANGAGS